MRILIIDDEIFIANSNKELLEYEGFKNIGVAYSGEKAVELVKQSPPDVALVDIRMPGMNGIDAAKEIKRIDQGVSIIYVSAMSDQPTMDMVAETNPVAFISKPIDFKKLIQVLKKLSRSIEDRPVVL